MYCILSYSNIKQQKKKQNTNIKHKSFIYMLQFVVYFYDDKV